MCILESISKLQKLGAGKLTANKLRHYHNIYLKYKYYSIKETSKMQCYTNVSIDFNISERTVITAVKIWKNTENLQNT
jgi:hypothetical protein